VTSSFGGFEIVRVGVVVFVVAGVEVVAGLSVVIRTQAPSALGWVPDEQDLQVPGLAPGTWLSPGGQSDVVSPGAFVVGVPTGARGVEPAGNPTAPIGAGPTGVSAARKHILPSGLIV
jgi:hypothetical protein